MDYTSLKRIEFRRKYWKFFGAEISVTDGTSSDLIGFIKMKAWKLREDIRFYTDKTMSHELFAIHARNIIDFGATYDVVDSASSQTLFSFRRKGLRSTFVRDYWDILDAQGQIIGSIQETSSSIALLRRWIGAITEIADLIFMFVVQSYEIRLNTPAGNPEVVGLITHRKNPIIVKMAVDMPAPQTISDPKVILAATSLLSIVDASKN
jgi:hypothetical protein